MPPDAVQSGPAFAVPRAVRATERGVTLLDLVFVLGIGTVLAAIGLPLLNTATARLRLGQAAREVERELQGARQRSVASNRPIRVRFNCPAAGLYRAVEVLGTASAPSALDAPASRCSDTAYPYPAADRDPMTRPNADGALHRLPAGIAFDTVETVEFWPNGTAHAPSDSGAVPWPVIATTGLTLTLVEASRTASIQVNGLGRITVATR